MRLQVLSDLHLECAPNAFEFVETDADAVACVGDISPWAHRRPWPLMTDKPKLYVAGNHEHDHSDIDEAINGLRGWDVSGSLHFLERDARIVGGVRFLGCTLWTGFDLYGEARKAEAMERAGRLSQNFRVIRHGDGPLTPAEWIRRHETAAAWLARELAKPHAGPTVVMTHFAPSPRSIPAKYAGELRMTTYVADLEALILRFQPSLWLHGHFHESCDYRIGATRVLCNPRGIPDRDGRSKNARFDPALVVDVG